MSDDRRDEELAAMLARDPEDPVRVEWERDPANRALARLAEEFERTGAVEGPEAATARARLAAGLQQEMAAARRTPRSTPRPRARPIPRIPALAAALALVVGGAWLMADGLRQPEPEVSGVLRGAETEATTGRLETLPDDRVRAGWEAVADAERYVVVLLDARLEELDRLTTPDDSVVVDASAHPDLRWWSIEVLRNGDVVETRGPWPWAPSTGER
ncbi:MAG TPA: hypothetical protein VKA86_17495 [Candidatus Krumholzibacteria bacterium]|nr:hypothetical protein [Candidatus Krumholzibacteria bacterium]